MQHRDIIRVITIIQRPFRRTLVSLTQCNHSPRDTLLVDTGPRQLHLASLRAHEHGGQDSAFSGGQRTLP
eukprot:6135-Eustigmatos_ZCMA.PRE.1